MNSSEIENVAQTDELTGTTGTVLGEARQEQNLSVADVARQLKLSVHQVEALEAGAYHKLPGAVFVRGFIRNYARLLKLDPERLVHSASKSLPQDEQRPPAPPSQDIPFPTVAPRRGARYAVAIAAAVVALAVYEFYLSEPRTDATRAVTVPPPTSAVPAPPPDSPAAPQSQPNAPAVPENAPAVPGPASEAGQAGLPAQPVGMANETLPKPGEREVRMVFDQESWVEIRDRSGKAIFSQLNRRGTEKRVNGRPPFSVIVGNSRGVRLTYDDRPVDLARHTKIEVARLTLQ